MAIAYLGLGSNVGERRNNIASALAILQSKGVDVLKVSSLLETAPVDGPPQRNFINGAVKIRTSLPPVKLLAVCQSVEKKLRRVKTVVNGPRTIDLDILLYDDLQVNSDNLIIPHPRMFERSFVLIPLKEIYPEFNENKYYAHH